MSDAPAEPPPATKAEEGAVAPNGGKPPDASRPRLGEGRSEQVRNPWPFLIVVAVLCAAGWFLVSWMSDTSRIQDCVMSGRKNCAPLDPKLGR